MESELHSIEAQLRQQESSRKETLQFWEGFSRTKCSAEKLEEELKKDNKTLEQVLAFWARKTKVKLNLQVGMDFR